MIEDMLVSRSHRTISETFIRFLVSGAANTAATYALYLLLLLWLPYKSSYTVSYCLGILLAYSLNSRFVFKRKGSIVTVGLFPLVYLLQYSIGLAVVHVWVEWLNFPEWSAAAVAIAITVPVTFLMSRWLFHNT